MCCEKLAAIAKNMTSTKSGIPVNQLNAVIKLSLSLYIYGKWKIFKFSFCFQPVFGKILTWDLNLSFSPFPVLSVFALKVTVDLSSVSLHAILLFHLFEVNESCIFLVIAKMYILFLYLNVRKYFLLFTLFNGCPFFQKEIFKKVTL